MRRFDKLNNIRKVNLILENSYLKSKRLLKEEDKMSISDMVRKDQEMRNQEVFDVGVDFSNQKEIKENDIEIKDLIDDELQTSLKRKILREETDGWEWARDLKPTLDSVENIKYFLNKPFKLYKTKTGEINSEIGEVIDGVYWLEENEKSPKEYNACWDTLYDGKRCHSYRTHELVDNFNGAGYWTWKFVD